MTSNSSEADVLLQSDWRENRIAAIGSESWIVVCDSFSSQMESGGLYCALVPNEAIGTVLSRPAWDLRKNGGLPCCSVHLRAGADVVSYQRFGSDDGIEPLVVRRAFHGVREPYLELSEEYRHFHDLFHEGGSQSFIKISDSGTEEAVGRLAGMRMELRLREIRQFLAIKDMHLALYWDIVRYSNIDLEESEIQAESVDYQHELVCYRFHVSSCDFAPSRNAKSFSRLLGKKLVPPLPKSQSGVWPHQQEDEEYEDFIIGADEDGMSVTHTCDPDSLANNFGANPDAPHYLTPVYFRREVLAKYYANPGLYSIGDGYLKCAALWIMDIDNNHPDYVVAFLGDLGRGLDHAEQLYWCSFNTLPGEGMSEVHVRRSLLAEFADPESPDLRFKALYREFQNRWQQSVGWPLFLPLSDDDLHFYSALRVPLKNDQAEFDSQVLAICKLLIDSINEKRIVQELGSSQPNERGISKLERYLVQQGLPKHEKHIGFLRNLQDVRSSGVAHRKGKRYRKAVSVFGVGQKDMMSAFAGILSEAADLILALEGLLPP